MPIIFGPPPNFTRVRYHVASPSFLVAGVLIIRQRFPASSSSLLFFEERYFRANIASRISSLSKASPFFLVLLGAALALKACLVARRGNCIWDWIENRNVGLPSIVYLEVVLLMYGTLMSVFNALMKE